MTPDEQLQADYRRAHDYWMAKAASYEKPKLRRGKTLKEWADLLDRAWFPAGVGVLTIFALLFAWQPVLLHGVQALGYSLFWSIFWCALVAAAFIDLRRRDRVIAETAPEL